MTLVIFNPEHDLCLGNGRAHYVPPRSAVDFARRCAHLMAILYPGAVCSSAYDIPFEACPDTLVPWGWNIVLKRQLLDRGISPALLPSDEAVAAIRRLQHRASLLPLQPDCRRIATLHEAGAFLREHPEAVLKAPWSGAGRGLRWLSRSLTPHDSAWLEKILREQNSVDPGTGCVIAQPRYAIADDFALLYSIQGNTLHFVGYSLFLTSAGVYRGNLLLPDPDIQSRTGIAPRQKEAIESWLRENLVGHYEGPLGVDLFRTVEGDIHVGELNLRHTMGHVAHAYLRLHPEARGSLFNPAL